jgi:ferredoxin
MTYVVSEPCRDCKYTDCVAVCPCDCFYQDERMLYIDPDHCIDCDACAPECPVEAIFADTVLPAVWQSYVQLNAERVAALRSGGAQPLTEKQTPALTRGCTK